MSSKPGIIEVHMAEEDGMLIAEVSFGGKPRLRIASMLSPPRRSKTRPMFQALCEQMIREIISEVEPEAEIKVRIMPKAGHG